MFKKQRKSDVAPEPACLLPTPAPKVFDGEYADLLNYLRWKCGCHMINFDVEMIKKLANDGRRAIE